MCLIPTYTEIEKNNQVQKVLRLMTLPVDTEERKKNFLYNLSLMNNMVVKGYAKEHTDADYNIYELKDKALNWLIEVMPDRCHVIGNCMYVYAAGRQYSYHFMTNRFTRHNMDLYYFYNPHGYKEIEWDGIRDGYALSDEEYRTIIDKKKKRSRNYEERQKRLEKEHRKEVQLQLIRAIKRTRLRNEEIRIHNARFWDVVENGLNKAQKKTKAYINRDASKLVKLYGERLGLTWRDEPKLLWRSPMPVYEEPELRSEEDMNHYVYKMYEELKSMGIYNLIRTL